MPLALAGIIDLLVKRWIVASFVIDERRSIVPHLLDLTYVQNTHGAMGLFGDRPALLAALAAAAFAALWFVLRSTLRRSALAQAGFGLVAGGALGNVIDRLVHGYVIDFISVPKFYIFNTADAFITIGVVLIAWPPRAEPHAAEAEPGA